MSSIWPVVQRELREGARRPFNYWLRVGSAAAGMGLLYVFLANTTNVAPAMVGIWLFTALHILLMIMIISIVPIMAADCIAREKRDGTLGLLFLTPLTAGGIIVGKGLVQAFRAFTLWVAVLPILVIPVLTGGIGWVDAASAISLEFMTTVLCLSAGLLASSLAKSRSGAFGWAVIFAELFVLLIGFLAFGIILISVAPGISWRQLNFSVPFEVLSLFSGFHFIFQRGARFGTVWSSLANRNHMWTYALSACLVVTFLISLAILRFAAWRIHLSWKDKPPSVRQQGLIKRYCTPLLRGRFARKMQRTLDRNPIAWLQQYSWKARLSKWGLCLGFVVIECIASTRGDIDFIDGAQGGLLVVLAIIFTVVSINGFMQEKKSGALELILTTPLAVNQIILGRAWGLWKQFLPAALIILGSHAAMLSFNQSSYNWGYRDMAWDLEESLLFAGYVTCGFFVLPIFATYFALRVKNLIVAGVLTGIALFLAPVFGMTVICGSLALGNKDFSRGWLFVSAVLGNLLFARLVFFLLRHSLSRRIYSF